MSCRCKDCDEGNPWVFEDDEINEMSSGDAEECMDGIR
jgi:hypothetical protein